MKLMSPKKLFASALFAVFVITLGLAGVVSAQSKKSKTPAKTSSTKKASATASKKGQKNEKLSAKDKKAAATASARSSKSAKGKPETKRAATERRRKEAERRAAAVAEQRRREQAAREARARRLAFLRGLRNETVANISNDKTEGEDLVIRQAAVSALGSHAGSVVVMEAQTGKVITIVNQDWAIRSSIKPCSTIKLVTGVAGLHDGVVSKEDGSIRNRSTRRHLDDALAYSDNGYFQVIGSSVGNAKMIETARKMGLGEPTGINVEGEAAGKLAIGNNNARIYSHGDDFEVSTLQLAVMVSAITNGGIRVIPRTPRNTIEKTNFQTFYRQKVDLPQADVRRVIPGMMGAAAYGTARRGVDASLGIAGKTGSCISKGTWVGLFASVAPIEKPKYSVVVITRGDSERGKYAAAVAGQVYQALSSNIVRTDRDLARTEFKIGIDPNKSITETDEDEDDDDGTLAAGSQGDEPDTTNTARPRVILVPQTPLATPSTTKLVNKTVQSTPKFPPVIITYDKDVR